MSTSNTERVTMQLIADRLELSKTTVSLALRGLGRMSEATRVRVLTMADTLGYRPDPMVASLAMRRWSTGSPKRNHTLAFMFDGKNRLESHQERLYCGAKERVRELGFNLEFVSYEDYLSPASMSRVLQYRGIRGLIFAGFTESTPDWPLELSWEHFTAVSAIIGRIRLPFHTVSNELWRCTQLVWQAATKAGYRRIGAALYRHHPMAEDDWHRLGVSQLAIEILGLKEAAKIPILTTHILDAKSLLRWYHQYKPEVIISFNHQTGIILEENGVSIPDEVQLVCIETLPNSRWSGAVHQYEEIGRAAVDTLAEEIRENRWGLPKTPRTVLVPPSWNRGETFLHAELGEQLANV